jgi:rhodanese-related sulfurtransferase
LKLPSFWWLPFGHVPEIAPEQLRRWLEAGHPVQLVDARSGLEYGQGTISGARHAPVTRLPDSLDRLGLDSGRPVVLLCLSGHRSRPGARLLHRRGFEAYSLKGGLLAWTGVGDGLEKPNGG